MNYLIDAYTIYAASVLAANSVLRSLFGAAFPLFTTQMFHNLGIHWAASIPAFLALACAPFPFVFYKYGESIRLKCKFAAQAHEIMEQMRAQQNNLENEELEEARVEKEADSGLGNESSDAKPERNSMSRVPTSASRASAALSRKETRASQTSRAAQRAKLEEFGRVYSHASHHHF